MSDQICRWGILSTANIARKNWHSIALSGNGQVVAVASRSQAGAQQFIDECSASVPVPQSVAAIGSYEELLTRDDIDAVYIPLPTAMRKEWVIKAANAGKHVLAEKPCGVTADEVEEMIAACDANNVQFMDGVMFMHSARLSDMRQILDDDTSIGPIRRISTQFTFAADDEFLTSNIRVTSQLEPAGCLGDLGWYDIRFILWAKNYDMPVEVRGRILEGVAPPDSEDQIPLQFQGEMHFADGTSATFFCSFRAANSQWAKVSGNNGYLNVNDFVLPYFGNELTFEVSQHTFDVDVCRFNMAQKTRRITVDEYSNNAVNAQEVNLFRNFSELVKTGQRDNHWPQIALQTQQILDAALTSARNGGDAIKP